jgi:hypothetical protein
MEDFYFNDEPKDTMADRLWIFGVVLVAGFCIWSSIPTEMQYDISLNPLPLDEQIVVSCSHTFEGIEFTDTAYLPLGAEVPKNCEVLE